jgi:hypothetical protein
MMLDVYETFCSKGRLVDVIGQLGQSFKLLRDCLSLMNTVFRDLIQPFKQPGQARGRWTVLFT